MSYRCIIFFLSLLQLIPIGVSGIDLPVEYEFPSDFPTIEELQIVTLDKEVIPGEDLLGQGVVFVFLLPTCPKCTNKLPAIEKSRQTFEEEGLTVIAVSSAGDGSGIAGLQRNHGYNWVWARNGSELKEKLKNRSTMDILIYDRTGSPAFRILESDSKWRFHMELCLAAVLEKELDLSTVNNDYAGSRACGVCHLEEWNQWAETGHAQALNTLRKQRNQHRAECAVCHVTGEAGKDVRPWNLVPRELQEVGCEECHGAGGPHRSIPFKYQDLHTTEEASCVRCHDSENSPNWNYKEYLARVVHGTFDEDRDQETSDPQGDRSSSSE